jgi:enoyl-CoA hydratase
MSSAPSVDFSVKDAVGVITLTRPEASNAQDPKLLRELDAAWRSAADDDTVRVIVLRADGRSFSSGHDLRAFDGRTLRDALPGRDVTFGGEGRGLGAGYQWESDHYLDAARRWRDVPKPSIAAVQGACIAGGLNLCWPCDLIVAADDAFFSDPVARMGIPGVEYHAHVWELGARKAKEILFTGSRLSAAEAHRLGMVNQVVPRTDLDQEVMDLARRIASVDPFALAQVKRAVNLTLDIQGQRAAMQAAFDAHWLGHANALSQTGNRLATLADLEAMKTGD